MADLLDDRTVPARFDNLKIFAEPSTDKNLELSFSDAANTLTVSAADRIWAVGQREQIKEFVGGKRQNSEHRSLGGQNRREK